MTDKLNPIEEFAEASDPGTRQKVRELLEVLDSKTDPLERTAVLHTLMQLISERIGLERPKVS